nr:PREDICTED: flap endonuclease 1 [Lepisosteus oculatus]
MGIIKLAELIRNEAPDAVSYKLISDYAGKIIALDIAVVLHQLRTAAMGHGIILRKAQIMHDYSNHSYVIQEDLTFAKSSQFDLSWSQQLKKRAETGGWDLKSRGVTNEKQECKQLLQLLGVPFLQAPNEAEALCAQLVKCGRVHAVASEDMDTMPFGGLLLLRQLNAKKSGEVVEYSLPKLLEILGLTHEQFVDLCILLGCDFCEKIRGLGPRKALDLIQKHKTIENIILQIGAETDRIPMSWNYQEVRSLFLNPEVGDLLTHPFNWTEPDEEGLVKLLCYEKNMKEYRVRRRLERFRNNIQEKERDQQEKEVDGERQTCLNEFYSVTRRRQAADTLEQSEIKRLRRRSPRLSGETLTEPGAPEIPPSPEAVEEGEQEGVPLQSGPAPPPTQCCASLV